MNADDIILYLKIIFGVLLLLIVVSVVAWAHLMVSAATWYVKASKRGFVTHDEYPWYVHLDRWIYHCEYGRMQQEMIEVHQFAGGRWKHLGKKVTFAR